VDSYDGPQGAEKDANSFRLGDYPFLLSDRLSSLAPEDLAFLSSKGSLTIPDRAYTKEFVTQYFLRIHPILPVLDEIQVWNAFEGNSTEKVSLFVFQALLFASCPVSNQIPRSSLIGAANDEGSLFHWRRCSDAGLQTSETRGKSYTTDPRYSLMPIEPRKKQFLKRFYSFFMTSWWRQGHP
jgi:hypothetical protein